MQLERLGVEVRTEWRVEEIGSGFIKVKGRESLTPLWLLRPLARCRATRPVIHPVFSMSFHNRLATLNKPVTAYPFLPRLLTGGTTLEG